MAGVAALRSGGGTDVGGAYSLTVSGSLSYQLQELLWAPGSSDSHSPSASLTFSLTASGSDGPGAPTLGSYADTANGYDICDVRGKICF